jgi:hypothetical protein
MTSIQYIQWPKVWKMTSNFKIKILVDKITIFSFTAFLRSASPKDRPRWWVGGGRGKLSNFTHVEVKLRTNNTHWSRG